MKLLSVTKPTMMVPSHCLIFSLIFVSILANEATLLHEANGSFPMVPVMEAGKMMMMMNESRRKLGSFRICAICTCCGGAKGICIASPCCYAIDCNIPNKPFGLCSFIPKACNCFGCHL
ncbi:hypothetical protein MtrunA17_Chr7g0249211 [Medicago truncatula]|uniref:MEG related family n=1 Tax=Medicago truncatula TaxID=3880 RepID=Q2HW15_MEDTR|nr:uncharacterized protein LOC11410285 [Medicago truncatula]ABD28368.1 hypothetical protein MtrDRAFT_AC148289g12v2 [Medicago truncatula]AES80373.1 putative MEG related family [Medicago truncatula]RHN47094.1 hypothetical protein MtrunA17_Chr7g0249211 [Medicago truncatula]